MSQSANGMRATALPLPEDLRGCAIEKAVRLAMNGEVDGIVTAPIDKAALLDGGYDYPGHTEMLAQITGSKVAMMLAATKPSGGEGSNPLRVVLATTHLRFAGRAAHRSTGTSLSKQRRSLARDCATGSESRSRESRYARSIRMLETAAGSAMRTNEFSRPPREKRESPDHFRPTQYSCARFAASSTR